MRLYLHLQVEEARAAARAISHAISSTAAEARRRGAIDSEFGAEVGRLTLFLG